MRKLMALLMILVLTFGLVGCASDKMDESNLDNLGGDNTIKPSDNSGNNTDTTITDNESNQEVKLPIVDETVEFEIWTGYQALGNVVVDFNDLDPYKELERRTNIRINWLMSSTADAATQFNLIINGNDFPDSFQGSKSFFSAGFDYYIDEGIITDITDIVDSYCPSYLYESSKEDVAKGVITDSGRKPGFFGFKATFQPSYLGPVTRRDWLKQIGKEAPTTLDELHDVLTAYKEQLGCEIPSTINYNGVEQLFLSAWGIKSSFYQDNGVVKYGVLQDEFLEYLTMMRQWYQEGLFEKDFFTVVGLGGRSFDTAYTLTGRLGYWYTHYTMIDDLMSYAAADNDTQYDLMACPVPALNEGDKRIAQSMAWFAPDRFQNTIGTINVGCKDPITLAKWYDYLYTYEGCLLVSYGPGEAYYIGEDGKPHFNELIYSNPEGKSSLDAMYYYAMNPDMPSLYDWERELFVTLSDEALYASSVWDDNFEDKTSLPTMLSISSEESARYASIMGDVETYIDETVVNFIIGNEPLSNFDKFCETIKNLGIDEAIQIQQNALERYNNRK